MKTLRTGNIIGALSMGVKKNIKQPLSSQLLLSNEVSVKINIKGTMGLKSSDNIRTKMQLGLD